VLTKSIEFLLVESGYLGVEKPRKHAELDYYCRKINTFRRNRVEVYRDNLRRCWGSQQERFCLTYKAYRDSMISIILLTLVKLL